MVDGSVVMSGARIGPRANVTASVIGARASIGADCRLADAVVGEGAVVGDRNELVNGARLWPDVTLPATSVRFSSDA